MCVEYINYQQVLIGQKDNSKEKLYTIANKFNNYFIKDRYLPVFIVMNYVILIDDYKYLVVELKLLGTSCSC